MAETERLDECLRDHVVRVPGRTHEDHFVGLRERRPTQPHRRARPHEPAGGAPLPLADAGGSAVQAVFSQESHTLPAEFDGTVISYAGSGTNIRVFEGTTELDYDGVGTAAGKWKVTTSASSITPPALAMMVPVAMSKPMTVGARPCLKARTPRRSRLRWPQWAAA